ncbi:MAG: fibrobacter succinogenes major paralogous domain-containing protein [Bacteroidota bacterium]
MISFNKKLEISGLFLLSVLMVSCDDKNKPSLPVLLTNDITIYTSSSASAGGHISSDGGAEVTSRGVCWSTSQDPAITDSKTTDGDGTGSFNSLITELTQATEYYVSAYATNSVGTGYGPQVSFITPGQVTDIDGNNYNTVTIGAQTWMSENLKTTRYRDGSPIPYITDAATWADLTSGAYCWYNNDPAAYKDVYGALYNFYTTRNALNLCPAGWHVPDIEEWAVLEEYLGGYDIAGGKLKSTGTKEGGDGLWASPNTGATNESFFSGLPSGVRGEALGDFYFLGGEGSFWSRTEELPWGGCYRFLYYEWNEFMNGATYEGSGFSVRCLKD